MYLIFNKISLLSPMSPFSCKVGARLKLDLKKAFPCPAFPP